MLSMASDEGYNIHERSFLADYFGRIRSYAPMSSQIVFTNGCFDIMHIGHVSYLHEAAKLGPLVVAVNDDASVARLKPGRPIVPLAERMAMLAALRCVSYVTSFHEDTPLEIIKELRPDILIKGADYKVEDIVGGKEVRSWGGEVKTIPLVDGYSTSSLIRSILAKQDVMK